MRIGWSRRTAIIVTLVVALLLIAMTTPPCGGLLDPDPWEIIPSDDDGRTPTPEARRVFLDPPLSPLLYWVDGPDASGRCVC